MALTSIIGAAPLALILVSLFGLSSVCDAAPCVTVPDACDFTFGKAGIPTFLLKATGDTVYGPVIIGKNNAAIKTLNVNGPNICRYGEGRDCTNQFYFKQNRVSSRTFQPQKTVGNFTNTCVKLFITSVEFGSSISTPPAPILLNLNPKDGNSLYPESRRCIFFSTGPSFQP
eukprot:TRINITY_DN1731_c0_g1_i1.p1 TRINITY_DN1731_c0_g1~~TRINITY_DN1731_c0_g1_i1.p1  ORF type:complete len:172 (+),score=19.30 TRINITY_DN1731_c0_g1_i1:90-605(+)